MSTVDIFLLIAHLVNLLVGVVIGVGSIAGLTGGSYMIASAVVALLLWLTFIALSINAIRLAANGPDDDAYDWGQGLFLAGAILSIFTGLGLAFLSFVGCGPLFVSPLFHWTGLVGMVLFFAEYYFLPWVACWSSDGGSSRTPHAWWAPLVVCGSVALVWGLIWLIVYEKLSGSVDPSTYPKREASPYKLPFPGGESSWVIQGNNSHFNHTGAEKFAWDFRRRCGTPVLAARAGTVSFVDDSHSGQGSNSPNNKIVITHADGTQAQYLHFQQHSAKVKVSSKVSQGDTIALVGSVGNSLTGHIHFEVDKGGQSIPESFSDVTDDSGIPRAFKSYDSGNRK